MKIGVISDTHSAGSGRDLPRVILNALRGVDLILHCGDLECLGVLDVLEEVAPVLAVRGYEDPMEKGDRLAYAHRVVHVEGVSLGMVHDIQWPTTGIATTPRRRRPRIPRRRFRATVGKEIRGTGGRGSLRGYP